MKNKQELFKKVNDMKNDILMAIHEHEGMRQFLLDLYKKDGKMSDYNKYMRVSENIANLFAALKSLENFEECLDDVGY